MAFLQLWPRDRGLQQKAGGEATLQQAETLLIREEVPVVPLYFYAGLIFLDSNKISGVSFNLLDEHPVQAIRKKALTTRP